MREVPAWRRYLRFWGPDTDADIEDELQFHLEMKQTELLAHGSPPGAAEREAALAFGDRGRVEAELREIGRRRRQRARRASYADEIRTDLRHAWRAFARRPGVPLIVVATLALGIGAGTAVFSLIDAIVLNPLAVERPRELLMLHEGPNRMGFSYPMMKHIREQATSHGGLAGGTGTSAALRAGEHAEQVQVGLVTGNYFDVLGLRPQAGRLLLPADEAAPGETPYVVLSDGVWRSLFGGSPDVVGRTVAINEQPFTVIGIAPPRFRGTSLASPVDAWVPLTMIGTVARSGLFANPDVLVTWYFNVLDPIVRVPRDANADGVFAELSTIHAAAHAALPEAEGEPATPTTLGAAPLAEAAAARSREDLLRFLTLLGAAVAVTLAVGCVNVANLMLMRATERHREMSVRAAVGASRRRVARQLLVESLALALIAGALGMVVALVSMRVLTAFSLPGGIALDQVALPLDVRVFGFAAGVSILCALAFGLAPAVSGSRVDLMSALRGGSDERGRRWHGGNVLVAVQVALSLVLLVAGSLFLRSLQQALNVDLGFRSEGVAALSVGLRQHGYGDTDGDAFIMSALEAAQRHPGVERVAAGTRLPLESPSRWPFTPGAGGGTSRESKRAAMLQVSPGFMDLLQLRILRGRDIAWSDRSDAPPVALVTESAAQLLWPDQEPLGQQFVMMFGPPFTVVGVVEDAHLSQLGEREPHVFLALLQTKNLGGMEKLRLIAAGQNPTTALTALRSAVRTTDGRLPIYQERSLEQQVRMLLMPQRFGSILLAGFGGLALLISAVGIYAVAAYDVARRYRELGIRAALGARRPQLIRAVLLRAGIAIAVGAVAGLALAAHFTKTLQSFLFGITPYEPSSYILTTLLLGTVAVLASWLPARRASRVDPLRVIRGDGS